MMPLPLGYKCRDARKLEERRISARVRLNRSESASAIARSDDRIRA